MALFGKKKKPEQAAPTAGPTAEPQDEIAVAGDDFSELDEPDNGGQAIDFDAVADELGDDNGASMFGDSTATATTVTPFDGDAFGAPAPDDSLGATPAASADAFASTADFNADDDLDFNSVFEDDSAAAVPIAATPVTDENPFGAGLNNETDFDGAPASGPIAIEPMSDAPPLTYTAPLLTSDAVATAGVPATRKSFPLPLLLGAIGLLIALGAVGFLVTRGKPATTEAPIVATNPPLRAPRPGGASLVNLGASVDGVPIAPGAVGGAPALVGGKMMPAPTPALLSQLKVLWKRGAAAKQKGDIAGARAAWTKMLQLRPGHPGVQSAIDKLPAA